MMQKVKSFPLQLDALDTTQQYMDLNAIKLHKRGMLLLLNDIQIPLLTKATQI